MKPPHEIRIGSVTGDCGKDLKQFVAVGEKLCNALNDRFVKVAFGIYYPEPFDVTKSQYSSSKPSACAL